MSRVTLLHYMILGPKGAHSYNPNDEYGDKYKAFLETNKSMIFDHPPHNYSCWVAGGVEKVCDITIGLDKSARGVGIMPYPRMIEELDSLLAKYEREEDYPQELVVGQLKTGHPFIERSEEDNIKHIYWNVKGAME